MPNFLDYGVHRFEARAVLHSALDPTPASFDWTIAHCNDGNRIPEQYASIESNGALTCIDCPHAVAPIAKPGRHLGRVYANKGWWTAGDAKIPIINARLKLLVWVVKLFRPNIMVPFATIPPKVDVIQATQAWCAPFATPVTI